MSIATINPFAFLDEDQAVQKKVAKPAEPKPKAQPAAAPKKEAKPAKPANNKPAGDAKPRQERRAPRPEGDRPARTPREDRPRAPRTPRVEGGEGEEGRVARPPRGDRPPRTPREDRPPREGKREFDRRSGTGRNDRPKREGAGRFNVGTLTQTAPETQPAAETTQTQEEVPTTPVEATPAAEVVAVEAKPEEKKEEEPKVFSLAEYEAQQKAKLAKLALPAPRVVETTFDEKKFKRVEEDAGSYLALGEAKKSAKKATEAEETKTSADAQKIKAGLFAAPRRENNNDRRGPRGVRGPRTDKPATAAAAAPKIDLAKDFPKLR